MAELHEECGVFGMWLPAQGDVADKAYYALYALQHRGQEGCGIAVNRDGAITTHKGLGLVHDVFDQRSLERLGQGSMAVAHARYGTTGSGKLSNVQPLVVDHLKGSLVLAHNGNLTNDAMLRRSLELEGSIFHTTSDSEVIAYILTRSRLSTKTIEEAMEKTMQVIKGAYSLVIMTRSSLLAVRDPFGFRPLCIGTLPEGGYVFASESCALDAVGATFLRDVEPGEIVSVRDGKLSSHRAFCGTKPKRLCVFELIYFARPDSLVDGISVHIARLRAGAFLALEHPAQADVVIGVPDSGIDAAIGYSRQSGIPYGIGFIKNKYIGRTFIQPGQGNREDLVRIKLNPVSSTVKGKRVVLIDDSIVRGTTSRRIVRLLREAGAKEVHFRSSAPKFLHPCYFGTDIDSSSQLFAYQYSDEQMRRLLDVDSLGFLSVENVTKLSDHPDVGGFCTACFSGDYPVSPETPLGKDRLAEGASDEQ